MAVSKTAHLGSNPGGPAIKIPTAKLDYLHHLRGYSLIGRAARANLEDIGSSPITNRNLVHF